MKIRDIGLVLAGALGMAALAIFGPQIVNKAEAQAAVGSNPGATSVIVSSAGSGNGANAGIIVVNDSVNKRITAVSYQFTWITGGTQTNTALGLSAKQQFTY